LGDELIGAVSMNKNTRINYLYVNRKHRGNHMACNLLSKAAEELKLAKCSIGLPNNASITGFLKQVGFKQDDISQYEMYLTLFK
jgi:predicted GNAT family N-acyltransferase